MRDANERWVGCADPRGERVPAGAGLPRLAGGRGACRGASQADRAVEALLALLQRGIRGRPSRGSSPPRPGRRAPLQPQPHRDRRLTAPPA